MVDKPRSGPAMKVEFRNLTATPDDPVEQWGGGEGILTAIDRGSREESHRIVRAVARDPFGEVSVNLDAAPGLAEDRGVVTALPRNLTSARDSAARAVVVARLKAALAEFGGPANDFARLLGTSASRMSTYLSGIVVSSAAFLVKAEESVRAQNALRPRTVSRPDLVWNDDRRHDRRR